MKEYITKNIEKLAEIPIVNLNNPYQVASNSKHSIRLQLHVNNILDERNLTNLIDNILKKIDWLKNMGDIRKEIENEELFKAIILFFLPNINRYVNSEISFSKYLFLGAAEKTGQVFRLPNSFDDEVSPFFTEFEIIIS